MGAPREVIYGEEAVRTTYAKESMTEYMTFLSSGSARGSNLCSAPEAMLIFH